MLLFIWYFSQFLISLRLYLYIPHVSKLGKPWSPECFNNPCNRVVTLKNSACQQWRGTPDQASCSRSVQARNKCSFVMQEAKDRCVLHKAEGLISSATGGWSIWSLAKLISRNFCPLNVPAVCSSSVSPVSDLLDKAKVFACLRQSYVPAFLSHPHPFLSSSCNYQKDVKVF